MTNARHPQRIQLQRTKGYRKPEGAVVVARPSKWGNPFLVKVLGEVAVEEFENALWRAITKPYTEPHTIEFRIMAESLHELRGKDLACWCPIGMPCHADVLLEFANRSAPPGR